MNKTICKGKAHISIAIKTFIAIILIPAIILAPPLTASSDKTEIVTSFFPIYLFVKNITVDIDNIKVDLLLPSNFGCPHDYALSPDDLKKIHNADILVINGLGLEEFLDDALISANPALKIINASDSIKPVNLKYSHVYDESDSKAHQYNPHIFSSPHEASIMVTYISQRLAFYLPAYGKQIIENGRLYATGIDSVSKLYRDSLINLANPRVAELHEIFDYLAQDFGFEIVEILQKEPGQEPSAKEMLAIKKRLGEQKIAAIFTEPQYSKKIAEVMGKELDIPVYELDPVATGPISAPLDHYEQTMAKNLKILIKAMK
jgi:ABC-type Zn uptake system ZnuABC Zn-binding protein ZnuA